MKNVFKNIKKYNWIFLILYLILILYIKWNANEILGIAFLSIIASFEISLFVLIHFLYSIVLIIKNIMNNICKLPNIFLLIITFVVIIFSLFINIDKFKINYEFDKYKEKRLIIINKVLNKKLENKNDNSYVLLPKEFEYVSVDGIIDLYEKNEDIAFGFAYVTRIGKETQIVYYEGDDKELSNIIDKDVYSVEKIEKDWYIVVLSAV